MSDKPIPNARPAVYATTFPGMAEIARSHGYTLAVHGSVLRDFDLIAIPWTAEAATPGVLAEALREWLGGYFNEHDSNGTAGTKPHGRRCWCIHTGAGCYIDLSIMPRLVDDWERDGDGDLFVTLRERKEDARARPTC
jgi:hypothetical protein